MMKSSFLKDVNLSINDGEFMVLVGPSGSGKTTMLKMINQLIEPTDGNIYLNEKRIKEHDQRKLRLETGYVLQQIALFPNLTVAENIALIPEMKGWKKEQIAAKTKELLDKVGLSSRRLCETTSKRTLWWGTTTCWDYQSYYC